MTAPTLALLAFLFPLAYSPGPGNPFFAANEARFGLRATLPASFGYHAATFVVTLALGRGMTATLAASPILVAVARYAGVASVLWIAWTFLRAGEGARDASGDARPAGFGAGALLLVLNPKAYLIIVLMFSQFLDTSRPALGGAILWIAVIFTVNNLVAFTAWTLAGDRLAAGFRDGAGARGLNGVFGVALALVAVWMAGG